MTDDQIPRDQGGDVQGEIERLLRTTVTPQGYPSGPFIEGYKPWRDMTPDEKNQLSLDYLDYDNLTRFISPNELSTTNPGPMPARFFPLLAEVYKQEAS